MTPHDHSGDSGLYGLKLMVGGLAVAFVLTGCGAARTRGATTTGLSGVEVFGGKTGAAGLDVDAADFADHFFICAAMAGNVEGACPWRPT